MKASVHKNLIGLVEKVSINTRIEMVTERLKSILKDHYEELAPSTDMLTILCSYEAEPEAILSRTGMRWDER